MNANKQDAGGLPELPEPTYMVVTLQSDGDCTVNVGEVAGEDYYTADQMRAYGALCRAAPAGGDEKVAKPLMAARETEDDGAAIMGRLARALAKADPSSKLPRMAIDWLRSQGIQWKSHCPTDPAHDFGDPSTDNKAINQLRAIRRRFDYSGTREDAERCDALDAAIDALSAPAGSGEVDIEEFREAVELLRITSLGGKRDCERHGTFPHDFDRSLEKANRLLALIDSRAALLRKLQQGADGWRPIESAPKDGTEFDVWCPTPDGGYRVANTWWCQTDRKFRTYGDNYCTWAHQPTHWREHPDAPASQGQEGGHARD